jgi:hypothetical protein
MKFLKTSVDGAATESTAYGFTGTPQTSKTVTDLVPTVPTVKSGGISPSTGEPDAGDEAVRFGGRGCRIQSVFPTTID